MDPVKAVNTGADWAVCGDCEHRKQAVGAALVTSIWAKLLCLCMETYQLQVSTTHRT